MILFILITCFYSGNSNFHKQETFGEPENLKLIKIADENILLLKSNNIISCISHPSKHVLWQKEFFDINLVDFGNDRTIIVENIHNFSRVMVIKNEMGNILHSEIFSEKFDKIYSKGQFLYLFSTKNVIFIDMSTFSHNICAVDFEKILGYMFDENILKLYSVENGKLSYLTCSENIIKNSIEIDMNILGNNVIIDEYGVFYGNFADMCTIGVVWSNLVTSIKMACAKLKTQKIGNKFIVVPVLSKFIDRIIMIDKILNIISVINLTQPILDFSPYEIDDILLFSHKDENNLFISSFILTKNELSINKHVKVPNYLKITKLFPLVNSKNFNDFNAISSSLISIFALSYDRIFYLLNNDHFEKFFDVSISEILVYKILATFGEVQETSKIGEFYEIYSSINGVFPKFIFRFKFILGMIFDFLNRFQYQYIVDLIYSFKNNPFSFIKNSNDYYYSIITLSKGGILQMINSRDFSVFWRKVISDFEFLSDFNIIEFPYKGKSDCLIIYGHSDSFYYLYIFNPLNGKDCLESILHDYDTSNSEIIENLIKIPWLNGSSLNIFNHDLYVIEENSIKRIISKKGGKCNPMIYYTKEFINNNFVINGFKNSCTGLFSGFVNFWKINLHDDSSLIKLNNNEKIYTVIKDSRVVVDKSRLYSHSHQGNLVLSYIYNVNSTNFFHIKYINALTGLVLFGFTRRSCLGPTFIEMYQHYIFAVYSNQYSMNELLVVEIVKNSTGELIFKSQSYILDIPPISSMSVTTTKLGLKFPTVLLGSQGHIYAFTSNSISARRSLAPTKEETDDGLSVYKPIIVTNEMMRLNKNITLFDIKSIGVSPGVVESATYYCAFSTSVIYCDTFKGVMEDGFDSLSSKFDPQSMLIMQIILTVSTFGIIYYYNQSQRRDLWE